MIHFHTPSQPVLKVDTWWILQRLLKMLKLSQTILHETTVTSTFVQPTVVLAIFVLVIIVTPQKVLYRPQILLI